MRINSLFSTRIDGGALSFQLPAWKVDLERIVSFRQGSTVGSKFGSTASLQRSSTGISTGMDPKLTAVSQRIVDGCSMQRIDRVLQLGTTVSRQHRSTVGSQLEVTVCSQFASTLERSLPARATSVARWCSMCRKFWTRLRCKQAMRIRRLDPQLDSVGSEQQSVRSTVGCAMDQAISQV